MSLPNFLNWPPALALLVAAGLKLHSNFNSSIHESLDSNFAVVTIPFEIATSIWLLLPIGRWASKRFGIGLFSIFAIASTVQIVGGMTTCGCFGNLRASPVFTAILDCAMIFCLVCWRYPQKKTCEVKSLPTLAPLVFALSTVCFFALGFGQSGLEKLGLSRATKIVYLRPETWIGNLLPIRADLSPDVDISRGKWKVLFYHADCPKCQSAIESILRNNSGQTLFIEIPPFGTADPVDSKGLYWAKLSDKKSWFMAVPKILEMQDGIVTKCQ